MQNGAILQWLPDSMLATNIQKTTFRFHMYRTSIVGLFLKNSSSDIVYARADLFDDSLAKVLIFWELSRTILSWTFLKKF